ASSARSAAALSLGDSGSPSEAQRDVFDTRVRTTGQPPMLLALRPATFPSAALQSATEPSTVLRSTPLAPELMRASRGRAIERPQDTGPHAGDSSELVLVARTTDGDGRVMAIQRIGDGVVPSAAPMPPVASGRALAVGVEGAVREAQAPAAGAKPQI